MTCGLCERDVDALTVHHLVPRSRLKKGDPVPTVDICSACHRQIHALFGNRELADEYLRYAEAGISHLQLYPDPCTVDGIKRCAEALDLLS